MTYPHPLPIPHSFVPLSLSLTIFPAFALPYKYPALTGDHIERERREKIRAPRFRSPPLGFPHRRQAENSPHLTAAEMKSSLRKLRGFALHHRNDHKDRRSLHHPPAKEDELVQATQDMLNMRNCYDSLLAAAAVTANSAYEFSEALRVMGTCLLEKTALNDDEDSDRVLLMLGKAQFELQKLVDNYRVHIIQTITTPSESLLKELQTVEEMKRQCDDKRHLYKLLLAAQREKGRSKNANVEASSPQQLQAAHEDYEEEATLFVFRLKSLKQGQSRSLLTQASRHHAAQLCFFRKGVKSLEVVEPHVKVVADHQHIDYQFSGLEDDDSEDEDDDEDEYYRYDGSDGSELSFDYGQNDQGQDARSTSRNSMELDQADHTFAQASGKEPPQDDVDKNKEELITSRRPSVGSQSAPISSDKKFDPSEKTRDMQPSSRKFHTYVLPTPVDAKSSASVGLANSNSTGRLASKGGLPAQMWHSSPLQASKTAKDLRDELSNPSRPMKSQAVLKESNINGGPLRVPPPLAEELSLPQANLRTTDNRKFKRYAFSGPLTSKTSSNKPMYTPSMDYSPIGRLPTSRAPISPGLSPTASPPPISSPKINELHELPRPPLNFARRTRPSSLIGHSAPLVSRGQGLGTTSKVPTIVSHTASPLPTPPAAMARSFSIPSSSQRMPILTVSRLLEVSHNQEMIEDAASPPLTPISLKTILPASTAPESSDQANKR